MFAPNVEICQLFKKTDIQDYELIARFLRILNSADENLKETLQIYISEADRNKGKESSLWCDQWWKLLLMTKLSEVLVDNLKIRQYKDLQYDYNIAIQKARAEEKRNKKIELIQAGVSEDEAARISEQDAICQGYFHRKATA